MTALYRLRPSDLLGAWKLVHLLEESGGLSDGDAKYRKERIYKLMARWKLEPDDLALPICIDVEGWEDLIHATTDRGTRSPSLPPVPPRHTA